MVQTPLEREHLLQVYQGLAFSSPTLQRFLKEIVGILRDRISFSTADSLVDFGCGKGLFLKFLAGEGHEHLLGLEPCPGLPMESLSDRILQGSFESNPLETESYDISFTCHTLHHLPRRRPLEAIREMARVARRYVVIVEINNSNLPVLLRSLLMRKEERNAFSYNLTKLRSLLSEASGLRTLYSGRLSSGFITGDSILHRIGARIGSPPYNIIVAEKTGDRIFPRRNREWNRA